MFNFFFGLLSRDFLNVHVSGVDITDLADIMGKK